MQLLSKRLLTRTIAQSPLDDNQDKDNQQHEDDNNINNVKRSLVTRVLSAHAALCKKKKNVRWQSLFEKANHNRLP